MYIYIILTKEKEKKMFKGAVLMLILSIVLNP